MLDSPQQLLLGVLTVVMGVGVLGYQRRAKTCPQHSKWVGFVASALGLGLVLLGAGLLGLTAFPQTEPLQTDNIRPTSPMRAESLTPPTEESPQPDLSPDQDADAQARRLVLGTWTDNYQGKRTMTLNEDGTGTMVVELSGMKARLFASRLVFEMVWMLEDGRLKKQTLRGEPPARVALILKTMGDRVDEPILELTDQRLVLLDKDGETRYAWTRVAEADTDREPEKSK
jgi:hypothetical protein